MNEAARVMKRRRGEGMKARDTGTELKGCKMQGPGVARGGRGAGEMRW